MPATEDTGDTGDDLQELANLADRQRAELDRLRARAAVTAVIATAAGMLSERLGCSAAEATAQLDELAHATGVPPAEMAASIIGTEFPGNGELRVVAGAGAVPGAGALAADGATAALAADGAALAGLLAGQLGEPRPDAAVIWLLGADGTLELLGHSGLDPVTVRHWRYLPPQFDCPAQRVAQGAAWLWWVSGRPADYASGPVLGRPAAGRVVLPLRERAGDLLGVLELRWPGPVAPSSEARRQIAAVAAGAARVLGVRLAHGDLAVAPRGPALYPLLDELAESVLVLRAIRDRAGAVTDFALDHIGPGYLDPAGRDRAALVGLTLIEAYPPGAPGHGLFRRALRALASGQPEHVPGPVRAPVPLADLRTARLGDGVVFTWRGHREVAGLAGLLDHVQRLGRLGGWEENLVSGVVRWTDAALDLFGLQPGGQPAGIAVADLPSYVMAADRGAVRRFVRALTSAPAGDAPAGDARAQARARARDALSVTFRVVRPDDSSIRQIRAFAEPVTDPDGTVVLVRGAFQDVSAHYLTQVALDATRDQLADTEQRAAEEHRLALRLQRAIMPPDDPPAETAGIQVAVRYRPAGGGHLVGGDWYDTLLLPGDGSEVLLVVGDVAGHGIEAVTGMIAARYALRGLAVTGAGSAELLRLLNMTMCHLVSGVIGTVICGIYDADSRVLRWARAGHLPPVLIRDGRGATLPLPGGILLGMDQDAEYEQVSLQLSPSDTLLFFTDGLIERRGESIGEALTEFAEAAGRASASEMTAGGYADRVLAEATSDTDDDACLVAVRIL